MTVATDKPRESNLKSSFAWGQLFVGSILSGFAIWKLVLKLIIAEPSAVLSGLAHAYDEVRDFLLLPFSWMHFDLTSNEKDALTLCIVLVGVSLRALNAGVFARSFVLLLSASFAVTFALGDYQPNLLADFEIRNWIGYLLISAVAVAVVYPLVGKLLMSIAPIWLPEDNRGIDFILLCTLSAAGWGIALLLLNWATS